MAKKKKGKYDITVGLNTDFENAMRIALGNRNNDFMDNKAQFDYLNLEEGDFVLTKQNPRYPPLSGNVSLKNFNRILISGVANHTFSITIHSADGLGGGGLIHPEVSTGKVSTSFKKDPPGMFYFEIDVNPALSDNSFCRIRFKLQRLVE